MLASSAGASPLRIGSRPGVEPKPVALVIGLGNTLRGDDALGRLAAQHLRQAVNPRQVRVIEQCSATPELTAELCDVGLVIFLDASVDGPAAAAVTQKVLPSESVEPTVHRLDPRGLLRWTRMLYGRAPGAYIVTFRGTSFEFGDCRLTAQAELGCQLMVEETLRILHAFSCHSASV